MLLATCKFCTGKKIKCGFLFKQIGARLSSRTYSLHSGCKIQWVNIIFCGVFNTKLRWNFLCIACYHWAGFSTWVRSLKQNLIIQVILFLLYHVYALCRPNVAKNLTISPHKPHHFRFQFPDSLSYVLLNVEPYKKKEICLSYSIQRLSASGWQAL